MSVEKYRNVVIYARSSTGNQEEMDQQVEQCYSHLEETGVRVVQIIRSVDRDNRIGEGLVDLLHYVQRNEVGAILVASFGRISQSISLLWEVESCMSDVNVDIVAVYKDGTTDTLRRAAGRARGDKP